MDELVQESDLIVIGTLQAVSQHSKNGIDYGEGFILIEKIVSGNVKTNDGFPLKETDKIHLKWQNSSMIACPRIEHKGNENQKKVWLLTVEPDKTVRADYPGRAVSLDDLAEVKKQLKKQKVSNRTARTVSVQSEESSLVQAQTVEETADDFKCMYSLKENKTKEYSLFQAFLVVLAAIPLYCFLYRSRFKIR